MTCRPLLISSLLEHAVTCHGDTEIVSRLVEGGMHRYTYRAAHRRAQHVARALGRLGVAPGDRVGTLACNTFRHFELCHGVSGSGAVWHAVNPRLFLEQIVYIVNHAGDRCVFFDLNFLPAVDAMAPRCPGVSAWIAMTDAEHMPPGRPDLLCYETLLAEAAGSFAWPVLDEQSAAGLCYTSGTTGDPKGVVYSHRSTLLHAYAISLPDAFALSARDTALLVAPMYHVNAWGLPYAAPLVGAKLVLPGPALDARSLWELCETEGVTFSNGVPTIWRSILDFLRTNGKRLRLPHHALIGGSAPAEALIAALVDEYGIEVRHAWGMTEIPVGVINVPKREETAEQRNRRRIKQGRPVPGIEVRIVGEHGGELPWDGVSFGSLWVRGHWVCAGYLSAAPTDTFGPDGWLATGDVATIDADGYVQIVDRVKDMVKSGGEWISSIELENLAAGHPQVKEAAVIGVAHEKWGERPVLIAVCHSGSSLSAGDLLDYLRPRVAKWWLPDEVIFAEELPRTATGKVSKTRLRSDYSRTRAEHPSAAGRVRPQARA